MFKLSAYCLLIGSSVV